MAGEVAVFAGAVGVLVVQEEEVVLVPDLLQRIDLLGQRGAGVEDVHADEPGQALVHRVDGDARAALRP